jgi:hypothetical protein
MDVVTMASVFAGDNLLAMTVRKNDVKNHAAKINIVTDILGSVGVNPHLKALIAKT